jgi:leucyl aminopeptidase
MPIVFDTAVTRPRSADVVGIPIADDRPVPRGGLSRKELAALGFRGALGTTAAVPGQVYVGLGGDAVTPATLRTAAAALARASSHVGVVATALAAVDGVDPRAAAQAVAEGMVLGSYRYLALKRKGTPSAIERVVLLGDARSAAARAAAAATCPTHRRAISRRAISRRGPRPKGAPLASTSRCTTRTASSRCASAAFSA